MGLDQCAFSSEKPLDDDDVVEPKYYWRKHAKLQEFMSNLYHYFGYHQKSVHTDRDDFNCNPMLLDETAIDGLEKALKNEALPESPGGFFFGDEFQDESASEYKEQDLEFCEWARKEIKANRHVYYDCWW